MSLESFKEMLKNLKSEYSFNFANEDDSLYFFEEFGGEERLKTNFPTVYESYLKARENSMKLLRSDGGEENETCFGELSKLRFEPVGGDKSICQLSASLNCAFIDSTTKIRENRAAAPWTGITLQTEIKDKFSQEVISSISKCVPAVNSYNGSILSGVEEYSDLKNRLLATRVTVTGKDPIGQLNIKIFPDEQKLEEVELYSIANIKITDPAPQNNKHRISNEIMMLYGRINEQQIYADADYKDGDYYKNTFDAKTGKVHLLLPLKGEVIFNYGVEPIGLFMPSAGEKLTRSKATYEYKEQNFIYRSDIKDDAALYEKLKSCFTKDPYQPEQLNSVKFDIRIADTDRSDLDWHTDVEGVQDGNPKTIYLWGRFMYLIKNQLGVEVREQVTIRSVSVLELEKYGRKYYDYVVNTNTIYIPPITIYWGCFGKNVRIKLSDRSEKTAKEIVPGDRLLGYGDKILVVEDVMTGRDTTIFCIKTQDGKEIQVSGSHPMMKDGEFSRASQLKKGDRLNLADGQLAEVESIEQVEYNDTVYNFTFVDEGEGNYIVANDFYSGDLRMQHRKVETPEREITLEDKLFIAEMMLHIGEQNG